MCETEFPSDLAGACELISILVKSHREQRIAARKDAALSRKCLDELALAHDRIEELKREVKSLRGKLGHARNGGKR